MTNTITIATHNGRFHADEICAISILNILFDKIDIVRTRDKRHIKKADIAIDVGGIFDPEMKRFDHHQKDFDLSYEDGKEYASAGLIWKYYGHQAIHALLTETLSQLPLLDTDIDLIHLRIQHHFIRPIDLQDTGQLPLEEFNGYTFSDLLEINNPVSILGIQNFNYEHTLRLFKQAVDFTTQNIKQQILHNYAWIQSKSYVEKALNTDESAILKLDEGINWSEHLAALDKQKQKLLVLFPTVTGSTWMVQVVPKKPNGIDSYIRLPEAWAGLMDKDLEKVTGVKGAIFCHKQCFILGARSKQAALDLATKALNSATSL